MKRVVGRGRGVRRKEETGKAWESEGVLVAGEDG